MLERTRFQFSDNPNGYSWSDGTPTASVADTRTGVWAYGFPISIGTGFELTVPADTQVKTLKLYVGAWAARARLEATLSDGSAAAYADTTINNMSVAAQRQDPSYVYTIQYAAASAGQTLRVRYSNIQVYHSAGNVTLQSAALTAAGANSPPSVSLSAPSYNAKFSAGANVTVSASASDSDGSVSKVEFFANETKIGTDSSSPYSITWNNVSAGYYVLTAIAYDNSGNVAESRPVDIFVHGSGGSLSGAVSDPPATLNLTTQGTNDWTHWGLESESSFNRKADVTPKISNLTLMGSQPLQQYSNNYTAFSWSDGTPTASVSDTPTGVFMTGQQNGFKITGPADTTPRRLKVYVGLYGAKGNFQAYLSDFSAMAFTDTSIENVWSDSYGVFTIDYTAASSGKSLVVQYRSLELYDLDFGNVTIQAATLVGESGGGGNSSPAVSITSPANNAVFQAPANITIEASASDSDGTIAKVEFFNGASKLGEDTTSPYTFAWNNVPAGSYSLTAGATDNDGATTASSSVSIKVNAAPAVSLTSPANNAVFQAPANITIEAAASDTDGAIAKVEFFQGSTKLGEDTSSPYSFAWNNVPAGAYSLTAKATDNDGGTTTSTPVSITVNAAPAVSITSPTNNAVFQAPANITIQATASDSDGTIAKVEFFNGATKLGEDTSSPYSFAWNSVPAGSYSLTAKATDDLGGVTTSAAINISVVHPNSPPSVTITSPTNEAVFTAPATFTVQATASDSDGSVTQVEFFLGATSLGTDASSPYSASANNVPAGNYVVSAVATDNSGTKATNSVSIIVNSLPAVSLTSPTNDAVFTASADITIQATASDSDGSITKVEFFNGATKLGEDTSSPYSFAWNSVPAGAYILTVRAIDNRGGVATSSAVQIKVRNSVAAITIRNLRLNAGSVSFSFPTENYWTYTVQFSDGFESPGWQTPRTIAGDGTEATVTDSVTIAGRRFYRVMAE